MNTLVVLFAVASVACGSVVQLAQPAHHPALVLDPHGRPLDTAEVINARALHLQAKALEHYAPLVHAAPLAVAPALYAAPAHSYHGLHASPLLTHSAVHLLKKRSLGHYAYAAPVIAPSAVSHQSRVDVISSPAVVSHAVAPVLAHAAPLAVAHAAPAVYAAPAAVSHQSRVDVRTSPALVGHAIAAPLAHSVLAAPLSYSVLGSPFAHSALSHGHLLKKRSLGQFAYAAPVIAPSAVSHQSRVDVISSPAVVSHAVAPVLAHAAPLAVAHAAPAVYAAPAAVSHQSRVDVRTSPALVSHAIAAPVAHSVVAAPLAYSSAWTSPLSHLAHASLW